MDILDKSLDGIDIQENYDYVYLQIKLGDVYLTTEPPPYPNGTYPEQWSGYQVPNMDIKYWKRVGKIKQVFYGDGGRETPCFNCMCACLQKSEYKVPDKTYISHGHSKGHFNCHDKVVSKCPYH
jgi:hypothetical protein